MWSLHLLWSDRFLSPSSLKPALLDLLPCWTSLPSVRLAQGPVFDYFSNIVMSNHVYFFLPLPQTHTLSCTNEHSGCNVSEQSAIHTEFTIKTHLTAICRFFLQSSCCEKQLFPEFLVMFLAVMSCSSREEMWALYTLLFLQFLLCYRIDPWQPINTQDVVADGTLIYGLVHKHVIWDDTHTAL